MEEKTVTKEKERPLDVKKAYTPPTLNIYGKLINLTAGGSFLPLESSMGNNSHNYKA